MTGVVDAPGTRDERRAVLGGLGAAKAAASAAQPPPAVVLLLHGGRAESHRPVRRGNLAALRMVYFAKALRTECPLPRLTLRYRYRGWNNAAGTPPDALPAPVADTVEALASIEQRLGSMPVILVGHSLGGRTAVRAAQYPTVRAVAALAPWLPDNEPVEPLRGRSVLIAHGRQDEVTSPDHSIEFARRSAEVTASTELELLDDGHAMLRAAGAWHRLVGEFISRVAC
ncbi:MAG TPA: alpha/beta fold hydrolase [Actinospica sp.]|jgi:pimeloyl-ACP methyl ester carboxylesterase|nr:alpha/beta fold hydrolase [Actinospica sp.]